ncbi:hypothetical protein ACFQGT_16565 [Natrialbaceae archaeon GCM10025810]|uniref:hypothetical protein n=1 Tax=Halovalidus salilacus TaxID=3075124 RepID=UPI00361CBC76
MSERGARAVESPDDAINWRQTSDGVTIYDEENPDAWIHAAFEAGTPPERRLFMICRDCGAVFAQRSKPGRATACGDCGTVYEHGRE